jgi:hypothetical protein
LQADVVSGLYIISRALADPITGFRAQVASYTGDNKSIGASTYGLLTGAIGQLRNVIGTWDSWVNAGSDLISPRGVLAVSGMLGSEALATSTTSIAASVTSISINVANTAGFTVGTAINLEPGTADYESAWVSAIVPNTSISLTFPTGGAVFSHTQPFTVQAFQGNMPRQAPGTTGVALVSADGTKPAYKFCVQGISPVATPTDVLQIRGSASRTGRVKRVKVDGLAGTAGGLVCQLIRRSTAGTVGGATLNTVTAEQFDENDVVPTCTVKYVSAANLSALGTSAGVAAVGRLYLNTAAAGPTSSVVWEFPSTRSKGQILRGTSDYLCVNFVGASLPASTVLDFEVELEEDNS